MICTPRLIALASALILIGGAAPTTPLVLWAWERPEDLAFAGPGVTIAVLAGTVTLRGPEVFARPRLQPAKVGPSQRVAGVVHVEIDRTQPPSWSESQRARTAALVLGLLRDSRFVEVQIDFEVRASQRGVLLDLVRDVRDGLPAERHLSMTALASWCETETWLDAAAADEIVPMLFRMGQNGEKLRQRLATGGDFRLARCRTAIGVATDTPPSRLPAGRRIWLFNPRPWTPDALDAIRDRLPA